MWCCLPLLLTRLPLLFDDDRGYYNYTPCVIADGDREHVWFCRNLVAGEVDDTIAYRRRGPTGFSPPTVVLAPEPGAWDSVHVCDPAVSAGEFSDGARDYRWVMAYLGCDQRDSRHNQLGLAFAEAPQGPWTRFAGNPILTAPTDAWGVGQASLISLDQRGRLRMSYTVGARTGTWTEVRDIDMSDLRRPDFGQPHRLGGAGLLDRDGRPDVVHDLDLLHDLDRERYLVLRPLHPFEREVTPGMVSTFLAWAAVPADRLLDGEWLPRGVIGPEQTGYPRNHNAAFVRDRYGRLPADGRLRLVLSVAETGEHWLWSYRLLELEVDHGAT